MSEKRENTEKKIKTVKMSTKLPKSEQKFATTTKIKKIFKNLKKLSKKRLKMF